VIFYHKYISKCVINVSERTHQHRSTFTDHIATRTGELGDAEWSPDSSLLAFVSVSRDHKHVVLQTADPKTGTVRDVLEEKVDTFFESGFRKANWKPPVPFSVKARDGVDRPLDLYGLMFKPADFDPAKKYPIINSIYSGPQIGSVHGRSFMASRGDKQALAELGFILISIDAMGTTHALKIVSRRLLRKHGRQWAAGLDCGHEAARRAFSLDRH